MHSDQPITNIGASIDPLSPDWKQALRHDAGVPSSLADTGYAASP
jgi:hypothetical protein